ncbi:MAG TPA: DUF2017 family protein [Acidimicrobiales bacterium]
MAAFLRRIRRVSDGSYRVRLPAQEREFLEQLSPQLRELLNDPSADGDPALGRLFPPAYSKEEDASRNAEYGRLMRDDLREHHLAALAVLEETAKATRLDEEQLSAWMGALNVLRLVLGTRLDVTEEMFESDIADDDPRAPALALYGYLSMLQAEVIDALSGGG